MNDSLFLADLANPSPLAQPALPEPALVRWQPLRIGLVELFHYDSEEFWFRDGHLLLRGNNGTGKSKVLSLTLPFLFDARLQSSRIEPDGDPGKKMAWNLLLGKHERRVGYAWIEFGRIDEDGQARYLTLGCGMSAVAARSQVDSWFFATEQQRMGQDLWLINLQRAVLGKDRLGLALEGHGHIYDTATAYRRAVDERLFHLGEARYGALMDTLIQLRQPQLSKRPNEDNLSNALTEALPPLPDDLLGDVAEAMNQLEEYSEQLTQLSALGKAIGHFNRRYQVYARVNARRQAHVLRAAQTLFDKASRELNDARTAFEGAAREEVALTQRRSALDEQFRRDRAALDEMLEDPLMRDATRLDELERNLGQRGDDMKAAQAALQAAGQRHAHEVEELALYTERARAASTALAQALAAVDDAADSVGIAGRDDYQAAARQFAEPDALAQMTEPAYAELPRRLRERAAQRRAELAAVQERLRQADEADRAYTDAAHKRAERADELADASERAAVAEQDLARHADALLDAWQDHVLALRELAVRDSESVLAALADWTRTLAGPDPARAALAQAQHQRGVALAQEEAVLRQQAGALAAQRAMLEQEREQLALGADQAPPAPYQRSPDVRPPGREGAPLWRLIEFRPDRDLAEPRRAGLEAALEASGLLDAWVDPEGRLELAGQDARCDTWLTGRAPQAVSLADWIAPAVDAAVDGAHVERLLHAIACGDQDAPGAEAWVAPDGRFRLGPLSGQWVKPAATYIGAASRAQARMQRIGAIDAALAALGQQQAAAEADLRAIATRRTDAAREWDEAPDDTALRAAHLAAGEQERQRRQAAARLEQADSRLAAADASRRETRAQLREDAADLGLPPDRAGLALIGGALDTLDRNVQELRLQANNVRHVLPERARQQARADELQRDVAARDAQLVRCRNAHVDADARLRSLRERVGAQVDELKRGLARARQAVHDGERALDEGRNLLAEAGQKRAKSEQRAEDAAATLDERSAARQQAVKELERFCASGLLAIALPGLDSGTHPWTIDTALGVARRAEQGLHDIDADDASWSRVQAAFSHDYSELLRALTALGHQAQAETSDAGMIVTIVYQNRAQRPDLIEASIGEEIAQRRALLTARETEVLENHLQAEVAAAIQRMLQEAERRRQSINAELAKRPTSTGVRFQLLWEPLPEGADGAPVGLDAARKRLLNTSFDAWSKEDRQVVGAMLQSRISAERARADAGGASGGTLLETLGRALDYRRWHRFRVQRWQDGQWRALSGPASSGERALGLTVPLFAAVSSFYTHGGSRHAPRLVLLDEAFAGIDDAARAHCMALVREFDLDFVMTSEREWGCYAELPGVSICQLQRHEGIDAVYVSRWSWDGRARRPEADSARRFPAAPDTAPSTP